MLRFPTRESRGEGVIAEVLGAQGQPGYRYLVGNQGIWSARNFFRSGSGGGASGCQPILGR